MTNTEDSGARILGTLQVADGMGVVRLEDRLDATSDEVWAALTQPARLAQWYGRVDGDLRRGGQLHTYIEADDVEGTGRVEVCEPPRRLVVTTRETDESYARGEGAPPHDTTDDVTATPVSKQTDLVVEVRGLPLEPIAFYGAGWQIHLEHLADHLAGREQGEVESRWSELVPHYQDLAAAILR